MLDFMRRTKLLTFGVSSTKREAERLWMRVVSSLRRVEVEYISRERVEAVLWKLRSSSFGSNGNASCDREDE